MSYALAGYLLLVLAAFGAASLFQAARDCATGPSRPVWNEAWRTSRPGLRGEADVVSVGLIAFAAIAAHYLGIVELPYWWGQRAWRRRALLRSRDAAGSAERQLEALRHGAEPASRDDTSHDYVRALALYTVEIQRMPEATETPLHTIRRIGDAVRKVAAALTMSALTGVLTGVVADGGRLAHDVVERRRSHPRQLSGRTFPCPMLTIR